MICDGEESYQGCKRGHFGKRFGEHEIGLIPYDRRRHVESSMYIYLQPTIVNKVK